MAASFEVITCNASTQVHMHHPNNMPHIQGIPVPSQLPPNFPPMASSPNIVGMDASGKMTFSMPEYQSVVDVTGTNVAMTPLPAKQAFDPATVSPGPGYQARAPAVDDTRLHVRGNFGCAT